MSEQISTIIGLFIFCVILIAGLVWAKQKQDNDAKKFYFYLSSIEESLRLIAQSLTK